MKTNCIPCQLSCPTFWLFARLYNNNNNSKKKKQLLELEQFHDLGVYKEIGMIKHYSSMLVVFKLGSSRTTNCCLLKANKCKLSLVSVAMKTIF